MYAETDTMSDMTRMVEDQVAIRGVHASDVLPVM
jgi:hypothetical protein